MLLTQIESYGIRLTSNPWQDGNSQVPAKKDRHEGHKHNKRNYFKRRGKNPSEEAPLLANDTEEETDDADIVEDMPANGGGPEESRSFTQLKNAGHWLWNHLLIFCVMVLLIGGVIALVVYFAREEPPGDFQIVIATKLTSGSNLHK